MARTKKVNDDSLEKETVKKKEGIQIYQIKITLLDSKPPIWRRVEVPGHVTLDVLHDIIQIAMGWEFSHLWEFQCGDKSYSDPRFWEGFDDAEKLNSETVCLSTILKRVKSKFFYMYDFGDSWEHEIMLEKKLAPAEKVKYPRCVGGKMACPPEDSGGLWGYYEKLECLSDPDNEYHEEIKEWMGDSFDPAKFDMDAINKILRKVTI